jgi:hypothetical protein
MEEKKKNGKAIYWVSGIAASVVLLAIFAINSNANQGSGTNNPSSSAETSTAGNLGPQKPYTSFGDGTYIVGTDILPGTYRSSGDNDCYWERLSGFSGSESDIIANGSNSIITIKNTDKGFDTSGCGTWTIISNLNNTQANNSRGQVNSQPTKQVAQQTSKPTNIQTPSNVTQATWHTVYSYSGNDTSNITTPAFSLKGSQWRVVYSCKVGPSAQGEPGSNTDFSGYIESASDGSMEFLFANGPCPSSNTSYSYGNTPGNYALSLQSYGVAYTVTVEDYY